MRRKRVAVRGKTGEEEGVGGIRAAEDGGLFLGDDPGEETALAAEHPEAARDDIGAINPSVEAAPKAGGAVDGAEVGAAGDLVEAGARESEEIDDTGGAGTVGGVASGGEGAGGGVMAFAVTGGQNEEARAHDLMLNGFKFRRWRE